MRLALIDMPFGENSSLSLLKSSLLQALNAPIGVELERWQALGPQPCGAFRDSPATKNYGAFQDIAHARTSETSYIQRHHFGALVALPVERTM
jgi:hypothetical protein